MTHPARPIGSLLLVSVPFMPTVTVGVGSTVEWVGVCGLNVSWSGIQPCGCKPGDLRIRLAGLAGVPVVVWGS